MFLLLLSNTIFALQNIYVYQVASVTSFYPHLKPGEIGGQFDLYYQFKKYSYRRKTRDLFLLLTVRSGMH